MKKEAWALFLKVSKKNFFQDKIEISLLSTYNSIYTDDRKRFIIVIYSSAFLWERSDSNSVKIF